MNEDGYMREFPPKSPHWDEVDGERRGEIGLVRRVGELRG